MNTRFKSRLLRKSALASALCIGGLSSQLAQAQSDDWDWIIAPYAWGPSVELDLQGIQPPSGATVESNFDDLIDKVGGVLQIHAEGQGEDWGLLTDFTFLGLEDEKNTTAFHTETDLDMRLFELAAVWSPGQERYQGFDIFMGLRYIDIDTAVFFDPFAAAIPPTSFTGGDSFADLLLGVRYTVPLSDRWSLTLRGDGSFVDTDGVWNAEGTLNRRTKRGAWLFGYRYMSLEFEAGNTTTEVNMMGPEIGYAFIF